MKNFNYIARGPSGALTQGMIQAVDSVAALKALKAQGMTQASVVEGKTNPGLEIADLKTNRLAYLLVSVVVALMIVWVAVRMMPKKKTEVAGLKVETKKVERIVKSRPTPSGKTLTRPTEPIRSPEPPQPAVGTVTPPVEFRGIVPPKTNSIVLRDRPKSGRVIVPGLRRNADTNTPNTYASFRTESEQMMSMMLSAKPGEMIVDVAFGRNFAEDFAASLTNLIEIYETDTEEIVAHKENVAWMKDEMRKLVQEGRSPDEILTAYRNEHNEIADYRSELQSTLSALKKEGKIEEAEEFAKEANKMLEPYGVKPLVAFPVLSRPKKQ